MTHRTIRKTTDAPAPSVLLPREKVAERFGISLSTLGHWELHGIAPPSARIGRRRYYREADVEAFIDEKFAAENDAEAR